MLLNIKQGEWYYGILEEILCKKLKVEKDFFSEVDLNKILDSVCYTTLKKIKEIIEDDSLEDEECFMKIEEIVCVFEELGSNGGNRHDFG